MTALPDQAPLAKTEQQNRDDARFVMRPSLIVGLLMLVAIYVWR